MRKDIWWKWYILILPHHLNFFKIKNFDISIAIDCLHEMDKKSYQIRGSWKLILNEKSTFLSNYSEFGYKII